MNAVTSKDGTSIAYDRVGHGPAVVLVGGAMDDGSENAPLSPELAPHFTVYNYARRGRGGSGDAPTHSLARELEDLAAVIDAAGGAAHVFGACSGGALALEAAAHGLSITKLVVFDVPYDMAPDAEWRHRLYTEQVRALLAHDRRDEAFELAMHTWGSPAETVRRAKRSSAWPHLMTLAPTLLYDATCMGSNQPPVARLERITQPTLVLNGSASQNHPGMSELRPNFFVEAADAIAACLPRSERRVVEGQQHVVDATKLATELEDFLGC